MNLRKIVIGFLLFCSATALFSQAQEFPKIMYVTATNGLRQRLTPSTDGKVVGTFLYCEPIRVREKSKNTVTIDGITDYWYKVDSDNYFEEGYFTKYVKYSYVFGGYLLDKPPSDAPVTKFEGYWVGDPNSDGTTYIFSGNTFIHSHWHGEYQSKGTFSFTENTIIFQHRFYRSVQTGKEEEEQGWLIDNGRNIYTYTISGRILKISKFSTSLNGYRPEDVYTLEKERDRY